jgi:hypothetical protein
MKRVGYRAGYRLGREHNVYFPPVSRNLKPYCDKSGALFPERISEKIKVDINGFQQGMFLKGKTQQLQYSCF